jgi:hypothetical protein
VIRQGVFRWIWFWVSLGVLAIPFGFVGLHAYAFHKKRWENSILGAAGLGPGSASNDDDSGGDYDDD